MALPNRRPTHATRPSASGRVAASLRPAAATRSAAASPWATGTTSAGPLQAGMDSKHRQVIAQAQRFNGWLAGKRGWIGEIGAPGNRGAGSTPDFGRWGDVLETFYRYAAWAAWPVTYWTAGAQNFGDGIAAYAENGAAAGPGITLALPPSGPIERHPTPADTAYWRGTNLSGPEFGRGSAGTIQNDGYYYSAADTGSNTNDYFWPSQADFTYLAAHGVKLVRLDLIPERMYPTLLTTVNGLDATQAGLLQTSLTYAANSGIKVLVGYHGHGGYVSGTKGTAPGTQVWQQLGGPNYSEAKFQALLYSTIVACTGYSAFYGLGICNEPYSNVSFGVSNNQSVQLTAAIASGATVTAIAVSALATAIPANGNIWLYNANPQGYTAVEGFTVTAAGAAAGATSVPVVSKTAAVAHAIGDNLASWPAGVSSDGFCMTNTQWQTYSQNALTYLRGAPANYSGPLNVELWYFSSISYCNVGHPGGPWLIDPANNVNYEGHFYWDSGNDDTFGGSGVYGTSYATELAAAAGLGY